MKFIVKKNYNDEVEVKLHPDTIYKLQQVAYLGGAGVALGCVIVIKKHYFS